MVCELGSVVLTLRRADGRLVLAHVASTLPPGAESGPPTLAGAIRVTPSGRYVLVSNRGHDSLVMLRFDAETPALTLAHVQPSGGAGPRDFCLTPEADRADHRPPGQQQPGRDGPRRGPRRAASALHHRGPHPFVSPVRPLTLGDAGRGPGD